MGHLLDLLTTNSIGEPYLDILANVPLFTLSAMVWRFQQVINVVSGDADGSRNKRFTGGNIVVLILGTISWGFYLYDLFIPAH